MLFRIVNFEVFSEKPAVFSIHACVFHVEQSAERLQKDTLALSKMAAINSGSHDAELRWGIKWRVLILPYPDGPERTLFGAVCPFHSATSFNNVQAQRLAKSKYV